jgi:ATP/maltotriose-dependent transcriptional regulator MalT
MLGLDGRADEALALLDRAEELDAADATADTAYQRSAVTWASYDRGLALAYAGRLAEACETARTGVRAAEEQGSGFLLGGWLNLLGRLELDRGHPGSAVAVLGRVVAETPTASGGAQRAFALNGLVEAHALLGQVAAAKEALTAFHENPGNVPWYPAGLAALSQAQLAWRTGGRDAALELMTSAFHQAAGSAATIALTAAHTIARFGWRELGRDLALKLPPVQGELAAVRFVHLRALVDGDIAKLLDVAADFERLGADLLAAEACGAASALADRRSDPRRATLARRTGERLLPRLEGAGTPDVVSLSPGASALTRREREIAMLAASGLTSQAIAARLVLSVRTVDNHLQRIYGKLGVSGRREVERAMNSDGPGR